MAQKWENGDSARTMTNKYNSAVEELQELSKLRDIPNVIEQLRAEFSEKISSISKDDIGLGEVDNTSDMDKPISTAQRKALDEMVTSEPYDPETVIDGDNEPVITPELREQVAQLQQSVQNLIEQGIGGNFSVEGNNLVLTI